MMPNKDTSEPDSKMYRKRNGVETECKQTETESHSDSENITTYTSYRVAILNVIYTCNMHDLQCTM